MNIQDRTDCGVFTLQGRNKKMELKSIQIVNGLLDMEQAAAFLNINK